jgi:DNA-binding SARP family transcriptional activator/WD40 repeat protein
VFGYRFVVWFGVLGPLEVRGADSAPVTVSGPLRRQVLAALLCRPDTAVPATLLIEDVWGATPPRSAAVTLRSHLTRLRDDLGRGDAADVLFTDATGYRLDTSHSRIDAREFERLVAEADAIAESATAEPTTAIERFDEAIALWRGEAYAEFDEAAFPVSERVRLAELRAFAYERRTDLALAAGRSAELVADLERRVRTEPYRERGWAQLALALYRAGRQADALGACQRARSTLVDDLGVDPGPELQDLQNRLLRQDPNLLVRPTPAPIVVPTIDRCPYLGLAGYQERDAPLFVGRERLTSVLAGHVADQPVVVVTGASGVGKSSLVRAGVVPALRSGALPGSAAWRIEVHVPRTALPMAGRGSTRPPDLMILDQAEELFTVLDVTSRDELIARLLDYVEEGGRLVLVLRSDFYAQLAEVESLAPFAQKTAVLVGPLRTDELRRALVEPAAAAGLGLEDELVETIMDDVADQPEPLPLLSEAMVRTWQRRHGNQLTLEGYRLAGELSGALEAAAEECFSRFSEPQARAARHLLVRMATRTSTGWVRRPIQRPDFEDGAEREAFDGLVGARLVVASEDRVDITHDALLVHWPRLRDWLDERSLAADLLQHLEQSATVWRASGRQQSDLYRGPRLSTVADWRSEHPEDLSALEDEFLESSLRAADADLETARAQAVRERRGRRRLRFVVAGLALSLVAAATAVVAVVHEQRVAQRDALAADARRLAALAGDAPDIATSSLLAAAAYRLQSSPETRGALLSAIERNQSALWHIQADHRLLRVAATADASRVVVSENRGKLLVYDPQTRRLIASFQTPSNSVEGITGDGKQVVLSGSVPTDKTGTESEVSVYDIASGRQTHVLTLKGDANAPEPVTTTDGRWVVAVTTQRRGADSLVDVFDSQDWTAPPRQFVTQGAPMAMAAGRTAVGIENADGSVDVHALPSMATSGHLAAATGTSNAASGLAISADGSMVARVNPENPNRVTLFDVHAKPAAGTPLPTQAQGVSTMAFSPDGRELSVGSYSGSVAIYQTAGGAQAEAVAGHAGPVLGTAWTGTNAPTGLYTVGLDSELVSWDLNNTSRLVTESGPDVDAPAAGLSGPFVAGWTQPPNSSNSKLKLISLDTRTGSMSAWPAGFGDHDWANQFVVSSDGSRAVLSIINDAGQNRIEIWDMHSHQAVAHLMLPPATASFSFGLFATISPDGNLAYSSLGQDRIGVFALPSGRLVREYRVRFADPNSSRVNVIPWELDPSGRLVVKGFDLGDSGTDGQSGAPSDQRLGLLDLSTGRLVAQTKLGDVIVAESADWSHDGRLLALGTGGGTLVLFEANSLTPLANAGPIEPGGLGSVSFSPDDRTLVTGGTSGALSFWSVPGLSREGGRITIGNGANNGGIVGWYDAKGRVVGVAPDEAKPDTDLQRWFVFDETDTSLLSTACTLAGADITHAQWARYVGDRSYRSVCPTTTESVAGAPLAAPARTTSFPPK